MPHPSCYLPHNAGQEGKKLSPPPAQLLCLCLASKGPEGPSHLPSSLLSGGHFPCASSTQLAPI